MNLLQFAQSLQPPEIKSSETKTSESKAGEAEKAKVAKAAKKSKQNYRYTVKPALSDHKEQDMFLAFCCMKVVQKASGAFCANFIQQ